ncbi:hypothetical protein RZS08_67615, partial [Arthrospira platensis SPKY1]|nr:hypothetical protein [Arthrospira platensis SPKY1]
MTIEVLESGRVNLKSPAELSSYADTETALRKYRESYKDSPETVESAATASESFMSLDEFLAQPNGLSERRARTAWASQIAEAITEGQEVPAEIVAELL